MDIRLIPILGLPDYAPGDDLAGSLLHAFSAAAIELQAGDVLVLAQKIISKVEGRLVDLNQVQPGEEAIALAETTGKDPRLVELVLQESDEISRAAPGVLIVRHRLGFISANAGIDRSNVRPGPCGEHFVLLLPEDPDASAARLRQQIAEATGVTVAVLIVDSHGRPFRLGSVGIAIGVAGMTALWSRRGEQDLYGYVLKNTDVAIADEIAAAAGLLMGQAAEGIPAIIVRGLTFPAESGSATDLVRSRERNLYR